MATIPEVRAKLNKITMQVQDLIFLSSSLPLDTRMTLLADVEYYLDLTQKVLQDEVFNKYRSDKDVET